MPELVDLPEIPLTISEEALFRYLVVAEVRARRLGGARLVDAVAMVGAEAHPYRNQRVRQVSRRTVYRWVAAYQHAGLAALEPAARLRSEGSRVLGARVLEFFAAEKKHDPRASVPELIRRARQRALLSETEAVSRVTVYRTLQRRNIALTRPQARRQADVRRYAFPHRMMMVLCDGKHFRAGVSATRRVALFFLDDATRKALQSVVGTSESSELFLGGLYQVILRYGLMDALYVDGGPGFVANDVARVCRQLGVLLILGRARCPECHGKIERFHQGPQESLLRALIDPAIDDDCGALTLRCSHYLEQHYNVSPHESLDAQSPLERWQADPRELRFPSSTEELRRRFVLAESRSVSNDNVLSYRATSYEVPRGHAATRIVIHRSLLEQTLSILHQGRLVTLHPVDLTANAYARRATPEDKPTASDARPLQTAARLAFERDLGPVVDTDGGYTDHGEKGDLLRPEQPSPHAGNEDQIHHSRDNDEDKKR